MKRITCTLLALALALSAACLAEAAPEAAPETVYERETLISAYEELDAARHIVYAETWEYPIIDGERGSGRPVADDEGDAYAERHSFTDGVCDACGNVNAAAEGTFITASGVVVAKGATAAEALGQVLAAIPGDAEITLSDVEPETARALLDAVKADAGQAELAALLKGFPADSVEETDCHVVSLHYIDADEWQVDENYAFAAADATLVSLY